MDTDIYDFIFPMTFRTLHLSSVGDLVGELIPNIRTTMSNMDIRKCITDPSLNILFLCDGFDEKNDNSKKLFNEICELTKKFKQIKVLVSSRPESVTDLYDENEKGSKLNIDHLKIKGIHEHKRKDFLKQYHDELVASGVSKASTMDLLKFYDSCSARHKDLYRLPINLVILSWLWGQDQQLVKTIKSPAGLYTAI
ncbi:unnamed protein product, partial [Meganyctiphanes norvegica]